MWPSDKAPIQAMRLFEVGIPFIAGIGAGTINTVVGSGSLITIPALLAFGYPPIIANMTNNLGVLPGGISGVGVMSPKNEGRTEACDKKHARIRLAHAEKFYEVAELSNLSAKLAW